jgi:hypothetical protein
MSASCGSSSTTAANNPAASSTHVPRSFPPRQALSIVDGREEVRFESPEARLLRRLSDIRPQRAGNINARGWWDRRSAGFPLCRALTGQPSRIRCPRGIVSRRAWSRIHHDPWCSLTCGLSDSRTCSSESSRRASGWHCRSSVASAVSDVENLTCRSGRELPLVRLLG